MESLRNAANAAASYVGLGSVEENKEAGSTHSNIAGGEAPQNAATGTSQSGVEPVSGQLGRGAAGEPYDAGNDDGASRLEGNTSQNPLTGNTSQSATSYSSGTGLGTNTTSSKTSSEPMSEKVRETFGIGGSNKHGTGLGGREEGPGYGTASKNDKDSSRLGSVVGHGSNPDKYLYNSKNAPGIGGHRLEGSDDFTQSNIRHEGADKLPSTLGSDVAAGNAKHSSTSQSSSGGLASGLSSAASRLTGTGNDRDVSSTTGHHHGEHDRNTSGINPTSGTGATSALARKAEEYLPGTTGHSTTSHTAPTGTETGRGPIDSGLSGNQNNTALAGATAAIAGSGRHEPGYGNSTYDQSALPIRTHDSMSGGEHQGRGLVGTALSGAGIGGTGSGLTGSHGHHHGISDPLCDEEREGYKPHGGHPIGEAAHSTEDGKQTWLDYRNDPTLPVARAEPADL